MGLDINTRKTKFMIINRELDAYNNATLTRKYTSGMSSQI